MKYDIWLCSVPGIGPKKIMHILSACGTAEACFRMSEKELGLISGLSARDVEHLVASRQRADPDRAYEAVLQSGTALCRRGDTDYPGRLLTIPDPPHLLFYKGTLPEENAPAAAIVGARGCSEYGRAMARTIARALSDEGIVVISGLAEGIDAAAHAGALAGESPTYAVLANGPDFCYPNSSRNLYAELKVRGGLLSEYAPGTKPSPRFFPTRNRLISALSDVVLVIEARVRSGSLITADYALEQGRDIYAMPGRITDPLSGGTNRLIRQGACPIVSVEDLLSELHISGGKFAQKSEHSKNLLEKEELRVYSFLDFVPVGLEELMERTALPIAELSRLLLSMERKGFVKQSFQNRYCRTE